MVRSVHLQDIPIRQVSCYALLRRCRLPWPRTCCLHGKVPSMVSLTFRAQMARLHYRFIPQCHRCLPALAHYSEISGIQKFPWSCCSRADPSLHQAKREGNLRLSTLRKRSRGGFPPPAISGAAAKLITAAPFPTSPGGCPQLHDSSNKKGLFILTFVSLKIVQGSQDPRLTLFILSTGQDCLTSPRAFLGENSGGTSY